MIPTTKPLLPPLNEITKLLEGVWQRGIVTNRGPLVLQFEKVLLEYLRVPHIQLMANGALALTIALRALRLQGEVITTAFTFTATTNSIVWAGLTPIFADIHPTSFCLDPAEVEKHITPRTSAILGVHVYGNPCYPEEMTALAKKHNLKLIYDAAHSFGVRYRSRSLCGYGDLSSLSFHATKVFQSVEGGAAVSHDAEIAEEMRLMANHGIANEVDVVQVGVNAKMNELEAAVGLCSLPLVEESIQGRKRVWEFYKAAFTKYDNVSFQEVFAEQENYGYAPILLKDQHTREQIYHSLRESGIQGRRYFYPPTTENRGLSTSDSVKQQLPITYDISSRILCLPIYKDLEPATQEKIITIVTDILDEN